MEFGKVNTLEGIDWRLPKTVGNRWSVGDKLRTGKVRIGGTGFSMPEWVGSVYPPGTRASGFLQAYAKQFETIEFNTTHYRIPSLDLVKRWCEATEPDFRFCPKVLQRISHSNTLALGTDLPQRFWESMMAFGARLGPCFLQLPERFGPEQLDILLQFLDNVPAGIRLGVELRHPGWFESREEFEQLCEALRAYRMGLVITDVAGRRDVLHMRLTTDFSLVRFVGNGLHPSDYLRVDAWAERVAEWAKGGLNELFFFSHQPDNLLAPKLSIYFAKALNRNSGINLLTPRMHTDRQGTLF